MGKQLVTKRKRQLYREACRVCFHDEAPRIGSGWRYVVPKVGRKRVRVVEVATGRSARMDVVTWRRVVAGTSKVMS